MYTDFDSLWQQRAQQMEHCSCPIPDQRWHDMVSKALATPDTKHVRHPVWKRISAYATMAAACVTLLVVGVKLLPHSSHPTSVSYGDQSVRFICNNSCNAQSLIAYFDSYIGKISDP